MSIMYCGPEFRNSLTAKAFDIGYKLDCWSG